MAGYAYQPRVNGTDDSDDNDDGSASQPAVVVTAVARDGYRYVGNPIVAQPTGLALAPAPGSSEQSGVSSSTGDPAGPSPAAAGPLAAAAAAPARTLTVGAGQQ